MRRKVNNGTSRPLRQLFLISRQLKFYSTYICINGEDVFLEMYLKTASIKSFCLFHGCFQGPFGKWQTVKWAQIEIETVSVTRMDREVNHQKSCSRNLLHDVEIYNINLYFPSAKKDSFEIMTLRLEIQFKSRNGNIKILLLAITLTAFGKKNSVVHYYRSHDYFRIQF